MKASLPQPPNQRSGGVSIRLLAGMAALCLLPILIFADPPNWWANRSVTNSNTANDYAAVNQGQLKHFAVAAYLELQAAPSVGIGNTNAASELNGLILSWGSFSGTTFVPAPGANTNDYAAVNLGQLKNVAKPFYDRLIEIGYTSQYPWYNPVNAPNDYAAANIGQVKNLFSFDVTYNNDGPPGDEGLPNWWELKYFDHLGLNPGAPAPNLSHTLEYDYLNSQNPLATGSGGTYASGIPTPGGASVPQPDSDYQQIPGDPDLQVVPLSDPVAGTVDDTKADLTWNPDDSMQTIFLQRRDSDGPWHTVYDGGSGEKGFVDDNLLANVSYAYRLVITYTNGQVITWDPITYSAPVFIGGSIKQSWAYLSNQGFSEFVSSGATPKHYLIDTIASNTSSTSDDGQTTTTTTVNFTTTLAPSLFERSGNGSFTSTTQGPDLESNTTNTYSGTTKRRSKGNFTASTNATVVNGGSGSSKGFQSSNTNTWIYGFAETYQSNDGTPHWCPVEGLGMPDYINGSYTYSGDITYDFSYTDEDGNTSNTSTSWPTETEDDPTFYPSTGAIGWGGFSVDTQTPTQQTGEGTTETLSEEYTGEEFIADVINEMTDYPDGFTDNNYGSSDYYSGPYSGFAPQFLYGYGPALALRDLDPAMNNLSIQKALYKFRTNPCAEGTSGTFYEMFVPGINPNNSWIVVNTREFTLGPESTETTTCEIDPSSEPDAISPTSQKGYYYVVPGAQLSSSGMIQDGTGTDPLSDLDSHEKSHGVAMVRPAANNVNEIDGSFFIPDLGVSGAIYTIKLTSANAGDFTVIDKKTGTTVSYSANGYKIPAAELGDSFTVLANNGNQGASITITLSVTDANGNSLGGDTLVYTNGSNPPNYTIPFDEASGSRYRKIGLNGRPLSDEKPQHTAESDEEKEETYIDALTLGLHHSTTDVYVPVAGSDLTITARRDTLSEVWNMQSGLRPHERPDRPFGAGWTSNLTASLEYVLTNDGIVYYYVTDQNGASHRFIQVSDGSVVPLPSDHRENGDYLTSLDLTTFTFTDRYGTQISFLNPNSDSNTASISQTIASDRYIGFQSGQEFHIFYPVAQIKDRFGNALDYQYAPGAHTLIPNTITLHGHSDQVVSISQYTPGLNVPAALVGKIHQIWDPNGNAHTYGYSVINYTFSGTTYPEAILNSVTSPDGAVTTYTYDFQVEDDKTPATASHGETVNKYHIDVNSITDPLGILDPGHHTYSFGYGFDTSKSDYNTTDGTFQETGAPRNVTQVSLPNGLGTTHLVNASSIKLVYNGNTPSVSGLRRTIVTDAAGQNTTYTWGGSQVFNCGGMNPGTPPADVPKVVYYTTMEIDYGSLGAEFFTFEPKAGLALSSVTDFSGNTTSYVYGDTYLTPAIWGSIFQNSAFSEYEDPTSQTDANGKTKTFTYSGPYRIMDSVLDEENRLKKYQVDDKGRRLNEIVYSGNTAATAIVQETDFQYQNDAFKGVVTDKKVRNLDGQGPGDMEVAYVLDGTGRVASETVVNNSPVQGSNLVTSYTYDPDGCKLSSTDPRGLKTWFSYDARNRLTSVTYADGTQKSFVYDKRGNKITEFDENGIGTFYEYDALNRLTTQVRSMTGNVNLSDGTLTGVAPGTDLITSHAYNAVNSVTSTTVVMGPSSGNNDIVTQMDYDGLQRLTKATQVLNSGTLYTGTYAYDGGNCGSGAFDTTGFKPTSITDAAGYKTTVVYDPLYRATSKSTVYATSSTSTASVSYDNVGNATDVTDPVGNITSKTYDALNRVTQVSYSDTDQTTNQFSYTSTGLKWKAVEQIQKTGPSIISSTTQMQYDFAGRPTAVIADVGGVNAVTSTGYDADGNVVSTINPLQNEWDYTYDKRNRKIIELAPSVRDATTGKTGRPMKTWSYDNVGNVTATMDPRSNRTDMFYDAANRLTKVTQPWVNLCIGDGLDGVVTTVAMRPATSTTYDCSGNVLTVTDPNIHTTTNSYDRLNRLWKTVDAKQYTVTYVYDQVGNRTSVTDGVGNVTQFTYDGLKRNTAVSDTAGTTSFTYDGLNKIGRLDALNHATTYHYDARNRLQSVAYASRPDDDRSYSYNDAGDLLSVTESGYDSAANVSYTYDHLHRVASETSGGLTHNYTYDSAGNRTETDYDNYNNSAGPTINSSYDALNRLVSMTEGGRTTNYQYRLEREHREEIAPQRGLGNRFLRCVEPHDRADGRVRGRSALRLRLRLRRCGQRDHRGGIVSRRLGRPDGDQWV